jgi:hypothetical protein
MTICAVARLNDGLIINMIVAEATDLPPYGCQLIEVPEGIPCSIAWTWNGTNFINPYPVDPTVAVG